MKVYMIWLAAFLIAGTSAAQIPEIRRALKKKTEQAVEKKIEESPDEEAEEKKADKEEKEVTETEKQETAKSADEGKTQETTPSLETYSKFDFIPGEKVIFFEDFSQDNVGDFPALWNTNESAEVVTTNLYPGKWMKFNTRQAIWTDALLSLPDNYTIEFDVIPIAGEEGNMSGYHVRLMQSINAKAYDHGSAPGKAGFRYSVEYYGRSGYNTHFNTDEGDDLALSGWKEGEQYYQSKDRKYHISIWIQKARIRLYLDENKLFDLPKALAVSSIQMDRIRFEDGAAMVSNIRIAVGAPDLRNKLITEGKLVSYGIYFDVNKDVVKPESHGTLKEIAAVLNENPGLKIRIDGHTDADGSEETNLTLSKMRAAAVKNELVKTFGINETRIQTDGKGESQPIAANDTPSNKALNRRVEFVRIDN